MLTTTICPKCKYENNNESFPTCPKCGVIIEKYYASLAEKSASSLKDYWKCKCGSDVTWISTKCEKCGWTRSDYLNENNNKMEFMSNFGRPQGNSRTMRDGITNQQSVKTKYPALVFISKVIRWFGYIGGLMLILAILSTFNSRNFSLGTFLLEIIGGGVFLLSCIAVSESIMVLIDIEQNTRRD
jgi:hypothetical protein